MSAAPARLLSCRSPSSNSPRSALFDGVEQPERLGSLLEAWSPVSELAAGPMVEVPVTYDGADLGYVAERWGTDVAGSSPGSQRSSSCPRSAASRPGSPTWPDSRPSGVGPDSNRVGLRLAGPIVERVREAELPSEGMVLGAVQVPPDGQPVVLLADPAPAR